MSEFNTQKFANTIGQAAHPLAGANSTIEAEKFLNEERTRNITVQEKLAKHVDDLMVKDLRGASLIRELEAK